MPHDFDDAETLSRSSDHLGNLANILKDLSGGATLLHELTQNANDAEARTLRFEASSDELQVWNSAEFSDCGHQRDSRTCPWKTEEGRRSCDVHSFRQVAGRHKADDDKTTGAFGVGFTAVYQVCDHPELVTGGWHLILDESLPEERRIRICSGECSRSHTRAGTTFFLPWARTDTALRRALGAPPVTDADIGVLTAQMHQSAPTAVVFLESLASLVVKSVDARTCVTRSAVGNRITISANGEPTEWLLLEGEAQGGSELKTHYGLEDSTRSTHVQVAIPLAGQAIGRVFADLPTETRTGWSGHINGTFFPRQDRKTVEFGGNGFRGRWNDLLIVTAARIVASGLVTMAEALGYEAAWTYLVKAEQINRDIAGDEYPEAFAAFFRHATEVAPHSDIALLVDGAHLRPQGVLVPRDEKEYEAAEVLTKLGLRVLHPSLRPQARQISLTQYGMRNLAVADVVRGLTDAAVLEPWHPTPESEFSTSDVEAVLRLVHLLQERGRTLLAESGAESVAIVPCVDGSFAPPRLVANLDDDDRALFELLSPELKILDRSRLQSLCPSLIGMCDDITPLRGIEIFEADPEALAVAPDLILEWLANHRSALDSDEVKARVRRLPVFPSANGRLRPLTELSLSSDFQDVLGVADVVDHEKTGGHTDLLRLLGARELDAVEYLKRHVLTAANSGALSNDQATSVLEIIHRHRFELNQESTTRNALSQAPLVATDQGLRPAVDVHLPNPALTLIDPEAPTARIDALPDHLTETLVWLGVSQAPNDAVLDAAAARLGNQEAPLDREVVLAILNSLPSPPLTDEVPAALRSLVTSTWLPTVGAGRARPKDVFAIFQQYLFESQGSHLDLPREDQQRLSRTFEWLGIQTTPTTTMVVAHLRHCAQTGTLMNDQVYRFLGDSKEESKVQSLRSEPCVQVGPGRFIEPDFVYWSDPRLGDWTHQLPPSHRQYQAFYDRVGVGESPSPAQLEQLLRRISRACGNDLLAEADRAVVHRCWELLDEQLATAADALSHLGAIKSAIGPRGLLDKPELLLFTDGRRLAESILLIKDNLIRRERSTHRALSGAGVRAAEDVIEAHVDSTLEFRPATELAGLIQDRIPALERLTEAQRSEDSTYDLDSLMHLQIDLMPKLAVEYVTRFAHQRQVDEPRPSEAIYVPDGHRLIARSQEPTRHLAREIALCIAPQADVSTSAPSILEILRAGSLASAMEVLDEYGVRDLDHQIWTSIQSHTATDLNELETDVDVEIHAAGRGAGDRGSSASQVSGAGPASTETGDGSAGSGIGTNAPLSTTGEPSGAAPRKRRASQPNSARLASYVSFGESEKDPDKGDESEQSTLIDQAGVGRVLDYERSCGRYPEEQSHTNPGFDVLSRDAHGDVVRRIEIKSIGGPWTDRGVLLSAVQFNDARTHGDVYWLYVVEHARDDDAFVIHRISNPAGQVTNFGFDKGWQAVAEPELPRDETGQVAVRATRGLLGWHPTEH